MKSALLAVYCITCCVLLSSLEANKRALPGGTIASQVRSLQKTNSDQVAVAIDVDPDSGKLDAEDDDKAHGFKSMTTSRIVPRFTRPITDI